MITIEWGAPGAGKSYSAVENHILPALLQGRRVVTNIPLRAETIESEYPNTGHLIVQFDDGPEGFAQLVEQMRRAPLLPGEAGFGGGWFEWFHPQHVGMRPMVVIDEAREFLHKTNKTLPEGVESWFSRHRKVGLDVVLITQNIDDLYDPVKKLAKVQHYCKNLAVTGIVRAYSRVTRDGWQKTAQKTNTKVSLYKAKIYRLYESYTAGGGPLKPKVKPGWRSWKVYLIGGAVAFALWYSMHSPLHVPVPKGAQGALDAVPAPQPEVKKDVATTVVEGVEALTKTAVRDAPEIKSLADAVAVKRLRRQLVRESGGYASGPIKKDVATGAFEGWVLSVAGSVGVDGQQDPLWLQWHEPSTGRHGVLSVTALRSQGWRLVGNPHDGWQLVNSSEGRSVWLAGG